MNIWYLFVWVDGQWKRWNTYGSHNGGLTQAKASREHFRMGGYCTCLAACRLRMEYMRWMRGED